MVLGRGLLEDAARAVSDENEHHPPGPFTNAFIVICSEDGTITQVSQAAVDLVGCESVDLLGSNVALLIADTEISNSASPTRPNGSRARPVRGDSCGCMHAPNGPAVALTESTRERDSRWVSAETELLSRRLVRKVEADLAQASMDIHDGVAQSMSNAVQILQVVHSGQSLDAEDRDRVNRVVVLLREGISDARLISRQLLPASLERLGLAKTLKYQLENLAVVGVSSSFTFDAPAPLPKPLVMALYRIASEALLNVKKHSRAKAVTLSIIAQQTVVTMTISDNGVGFERDVQEPDAETGLGLMSMDARARLLGGTFTIVTSPGGGTVVTVVLPTTHLDERDSTAARIEHPTIEKAVGA